MSLCTFSELVCAHFCGWNDRVENQGHSLWIKGQESEGNASLQFSIPPGRLHLMNWVHLRAMETGSKGTISLDLHEWKLRHEGQKGRHLPRTLLIPPDISSCVYSACCYVCVVNTVLVLWYTCCNQLSSLGFLTRPTRAVNEEPHTLADQTNLLALDEWDHHYFNDTAAGMGVDCIISCTVLTKQNVDWQKKNYMSVR